MVGLSEWDVVVSDSFDLDPKEIAKWFVLATDRESGNVTTHLKVQKLLYYAQGWCLARHDKTLFDEDIEAWVHGPVVRSVYDFYAGSKYEPLPAKKLKKTFRGKVTSLLSAVNDRYSMFSAKGLERKTHKEPAWIEARGNVSSDERCNTPFKISTMKAYFKSLE